MTTRHRFYAHRSEGNVHPCPECNGTGKHESTGKCVKCDGLGEVVTPLTREDRLALGKLCTKDEAGRHFMETHDCDWLNRMSEIGLLEIIKPVHEQTGIPYSQEHWSVEVAPEVADWFDDCGELIED